MLQARFFTGVQQHAIDLVSLFSAVKQEEGNR